MTRALQLATWLFAGLLIANVFGFLAASAIGNADAALDFALGAVGAYACLIALAFVGAFE